MAVLLNFYTMLQDYDIIPKEMRAYLRNNGRHFNKKACEWAVKNMRKWNSNTNSSEKIEMKSKDEIDELLKTHGITLNKNKGYDYVYVANMCYADFYKSSIEDDRHVAMFVKDMVDDYDQPSGFIFNRWIADMDGSETPIEWEDFL